MCRSPPQRVSSWCSVPCASDSYALFLVSGFSRSPGSLGGWSRKSRTKWARREVRLLLRVSHRVVMGWGVGFALAPGAGEGAGRGAAGVFALISSAMHALSRLRRKAKNESKACTTTPVHLSRSCGGAVLRSRSRVNPDDTTVIVMLREWQTRAIESWSMAVRRRWVLPSGLPVASAVSGRSFFAESRGWIRDFVRSEMGESAWLRVCWRWYMCRMKDIVVGSPVFLLDLGRSLHGHCLES